LKEDMTWIYSGGYLKRAKGRLDPYFGEKRLRSGFGRRLPGVSRLKKNAGRMLLPGN